MRQFPSRGRTALGDLMDSRASVFDDRRTVHLAVAGTSEAALAERVGDAGQVRVREEGHVFHAEVFVDPSGGALRLGDLERIRDAVRAVDWKLHDVLVAPVRQLPRGNLPVT